MSRSAGAGIAKLIRDAAQPFGDIESADLGPLLDRIGNARVILIGEASHGTSEFYRMRARITQALIGRGGVSIVAVEADWPDARWVDGYVRHAPAPPAGERPFQRFPRWMWQNREVHAFVDWLREYNAARPLPNDRVGFYGLDLYSMHASIEAVLHYLERIDPAAARQARARYACLTPWQDEPAAYGHAATTDRYRSCEGEVLLILRDLLSRRLQYQHGEAEDRYLDAVQNARLVANAEEYYRAMYYSSTESWNLRDQHMFETLEALLGARGIGARAVVWAHNSHVGNAAATEMGRTGQLNVGMLCRRKFGPAACLMGFGTDHGTVAAAHDWDEPMEIMSVRPALRGSYEEIVHASGLGAGFLPLGPRAPAALVDALTPERLERAIGVIYRPTTERESHYFGASLPQQFDEYIWFDETTAVTPLPGPSEAGVPETYPFGL
ncbi:MAG TPA: erythromycin esterase family protein [Gemmatimonadales bacterium]|nr:erythromycin esterase family protein [Gemmatimonadales bacterium]